MAKKKDEGHEETEAVLREMEKRISEEYKQAEKEIEDKINDYYQRFEKKDEIKRKAMENGLISEDEYTEWRIGQLMVGKRWEEMRDSLAQDFTNADKIAKSISYGYMPDVYAINHNYGTYQVEHESKIDTSYTLYSRDTVEYLFNDNNTFYPAPGRKVSAMIKEGKTLAWNKKNVQSVMLQGIMQGESISKIASRLSNSVGEQNRKVAIRNARTMTTGVQNAGRIKSYDRALSMGIEMKKQWRAALDNRTRHWHRELDGVSLENDEYFENEVGKILFPGDPSADAANIYNCRCTLRPVIKGFEPDASDLTSRKNKLGDMSYEEWKNEKKSTSDPITKQDDIAEKMRKVYGAEYKNILDSMNDNNDESDIGRKLLSVFKTVDGQVDDFKRNINNSNEVVRNVLKKEADETKYARSKKKKSYYSRQDKKVYLKKGIPDGTTAHETFHAIDDRYQITSKGALTNNILKDYNLLLKKSAKYGGIEEYFKAKYPLAFNSDGVIKDEYRGISDIIHGCTDGDVFLGYGHKDNEYWKRKKAMEKETFAQMGRTYYNNNKDAIVVLENEFTNVVNEFKAIMRGI